ncbi:hypothetical protein HC174_07090 [Salinimicrobium sp. CDJ15-81-2]|nr:hypothetical protein [Salinimicrobium nanhaiense]
MKWCFCLISCLFFISAFSQSTYTSSYTQTWPTIFNTHVEEVKRSISFEENAIILATETKSGKEMETFLIRNIEQNDEITEYSCLTRDNYRITILKPLRNLMFIDIYRPSAKSGEEIQLRLHLDL